MFMADKLIFHHVKSFDYSSYKLVRKVESSSWLPVWETDFLLSVYSWICLNWTLNELGTCLTWTLDELGTCLNWTLDELETCLNQSSCEVA